MVLLPITWLDTAINTRLSTSHCHRTGPASWTVSPGRHTILLWNSCSTQHFCRHFHRSTPMERSINPASPPKFRPQLNLAQYLLLQFLPVSWNDVFSIQLSSPHEQSGFLLFSRRQQSCQKLYVLPTVLLLLLDNRLTCDQTANQCQVKSIPVIRTDVWHE